MPRAMDIPSFKVATTNTPCSHNPLGVKGCGEAGAIGSPPAYINALTDALGVVDLAMPATPERVWRAANGMRRLNDKENNDVRIRLPAADQPRCRQGAPPPAPTRASSPAARA